MIFTIINCTILVLSVSLILFHRKNYCKALLENKLLKVQIVIMSNVWKAKMHSSLLTDNQRKYIASLARALHFKQDIIYIANVETVKNWYRKFIGPIFKSLAKKTGRPRISDTVKRLVCRFRKYYKWGYGRIVGEVNQLGYELSKSSIPHILRTFKPDKPKGRFSLPKLSHIYAMDFKIHCNHLGQKFFTLIFINHKVREAVHMRSTCGEPSKEWIENQLKEITADGKSITLKHDNDLRFKHLDFQKFGIKSEPIPAHSPNHNAIVERFIQSFQNEALAHYPEFDLKKLNRISKEYKTYYNNYRPHQGIGNVTIPVYKEILKGNVPLLQRDIPVPGKLCKKEFLDGHLVHHYYKKSA